jgi:hypothetical protein
MPRKLWTAPTQTFLTGENSKLLGIIFRTLNEYLRTHIGFWTELTGTTDIKGELIFAVDPGFDPATVLITEQHVDGTAHDLGPCHVEYYTSTELKVKFLTKAGQDRATHGVKIGCLFLPKTS